MINMENDICIRQFTSEDSEPFYLAVQESVGHVSRWLSWCTPAYSRQEAQIWADSAAAAWQQGTDYRFIIEDVNTQQVLGSVAINQVVHAHKVGNLGYWVRTSALNKGVCTRAARMALTYAFTHLDFQRIEVHVHRKNRASNAVAAKLGGVYEGEFRNKLFFEGQSVPAKCYSIIPSDYHL